MLETLSLYIFCALIGGLIALVADLIFGHKSFSIFFIGIAAIIAIYATILLISGGLALALIGYIISAITLAIGLIFKRRAPKEKKAKKKKTEEIYCGDDTTAEFLAAALAQVGMKNTEIFTVDGEYFVEVRK